MANFNAHSVVIISYLLISIVQLHNCVVICTANSNVSQSNLITTSNHDTFNVQAVQSEPLDDSHGRTGQLASAPYQLDSHANFVSPDGQLIASVPASMLQDMASDQKDDSIRQPSESFNLREMLDQFSSNIRQNISFAPSSNGAASNVESSNNVMVIDGETVLSTLANNHRLKPQPIRNLNKAATVINLMPMVPTRSSIIEVAAENFTMRKISEQANIFAMRLLSQIDQEQLYATNLIVGPFAVYQGLALLLSGAQGETAQQLDQLLLGSESTYTELAKQSSSLNQDRPRLMVSLNEIIKNLRQNSTRNSNYGLSVQQNTQLLKPLITANHLLLSPSTEISNEFRHIIENYYDEVPLTKMEIGSLESVLNVNNWIRSVTNGIIPNILSRKTTFDEFNVMTLLSTAWMQQEWLDNFQRVTSQTKQFVRLKSGRGVIATAGQQQQHQSNSQQQPAKAPILMEFVDDNRQSHFVEYIVSQPSKNIKRFKMEIASSLKVDVVEVPFKYSDYKMVVLMPQQLNNLPVVNNIGSAESTNQASSPTSNNVANGGLTKLIQLLSNNPKDSLRDIFNLIDPDMLTKSIYDNQQSSRKSNFSNFVVRDDDLDDSDTDANDFRVPNGIKLSMPLLKTEADLTLSATLNKLGITSALDPYQANFIGINGHPFNYYKLHLSKVLFKSNMNIDERGINYDKTIQTLEALRLAAQMDRNRIASSLEPANGINQSDIEEFSLNRPYMYFIRDYKTKLIWFVGTVRDPSFGM